MKILAISDTHFGHDRLSEITWRPVDFTERILTALSKEEGDLLIHCGDFCIGNDLIWGESFHKATRGFACKVLVRGNHDKKSDAWYTTISGFQVVCDQLVATHFGKRIAYTHKPIDRYEGIAGAEMNIHGHLHGNNHRPEYAALLVPGFHYDLAPEKNDYKPVNVASIIN